MRYTIQNTKTIPLKNGKVKYEVWTDQGKFFTWAREIGEAQPGTVVEALAEESRWQNRSGQWNTDMMLKLVEGGQGGRSASPGQPPAQQRQQAASMDNEYIAVEAVKLAVNVAGNQAPASDVTARALAYSEIMLAVLKDISTPKWEKALKAAALVREVRSVGMTRADLESMFALAKGEVEVFIEAVKATIAAKRTPPPATAGAEQDDDLPF